MDNWQKILIKKFKGILIDMKSDFLSKMIDNYKRKESDTIQSILLEHSAYNTDHVYSNEKGIKKYFKVDY